MEGDRQISIGASLYQCAVECALRRKKKVCKRRFGDMTCCNCKQYLYNYWDADPRQVQLFLVTAEKEADMIYRQSRSHHPIFAASITACLLMALLMWCKHISQQKILAPVPTVKAVSSKVSDTKQIKDTLKLVAHDLERDIDVNGDGKTNCVDAAVLFYQYYPERRNCYITLNKDNPKALYFNHLFNTVMVDGIWRAIEPQAEFANKASFYMRDVWPNEYDSTYNTSATGIYIKYVK